MRISDPDRVVVDFEDVPLLSQRTVNVNGKFVKDIRYAAFDSDTPGSLDLTGQHNYSYIEENGKLVLTVDKTPFNYLKYHNNTNNINLEIEGVKLSSSTDSRESLRMLVRFHQEKYARFFPVKRQEFRKWGNTH